jgi:hypothetical protein
MARKQQQRNNVLCAVRAYGCARSSGICHATAKQKFRCNRNGVFYAVRADVISKTVTCYMTLIRSVMNDACPAWEFAANTYLLKLQRLQKKVLRTTGNFASCTLVRDLYTTLRAFRLYTII